MRIHLKKIIEMIGRILVMNGGRCRSRVNKTRRRKFSLLSFMTLARSLWAGHGACMGHRGVHYSVTGVLDVSRLPLSSSLAMMLSMDILTYSLYEDFTDALRCQSNKDDDGLGKGLTAAQQGNRIDELVKPRLSAWVDANSKCLSE